MARKDRYAYRPIALCSVLALGGLLLLLLGLKQIMALRGPRLLLGLVLLFAAGLLFLAVYLLGRCAVIVDQQGVRDRRVVGDWRLLRWEDIASVTRKHVVREGRTGGYTALVFIGRQGEEMEIVEKDEILALVGKYGPTVEKETV